MKLSPTPGDAPAGATGAAELKPLLTPAELGRLLRVPEATLQAWRSSGRVELPFVRLGGHVRYPAEGVARFIAAHTSPRGPMS